MVVLRGFRRALLTAATLSVVVLLLSTSCSIEGLRLEDRDNPRDLIHHPKVVGVYRNSTATPLQTGDRLTDNSDSILVEFSMAMNQNSVEDALLLQDTADPPNAYEPPMAWSENYLLTIDAPPAGWPPGLRINLVILQEAMNIAEKRFSATFESFFRTAE